MSQRAPARSLKGRKAKLPVNVPRVDVSKPISSKQVTDNEPTDLKKNKQARKGDFDSSLDVNPAQQSGSQAIPLAILPILQGISICRNSDQESPSTSQQTMPPNPSTPQSNCPIDLLPEEQLISIFRILPWSDLLKLRMICRRWYHYIGGMRDSYRSLKLFTDANDVEVYKDKLKLYNLQNNNDFKMATKLETEDIVVLRRSAASDYETLGSALHYLAPNLSNLVLYYNKFTKIPVSMNAVLAGLLKHSPELESLTIFGMTKDESLTSEFWDALIECTSLRRLHLFDLFKSNIGLEADSEVSKQVDKHRQVFTRLEELTLVNYHESLLPVLRALDDAPNCRKLNLNFVTHPTYMCTKLYYSNTFDALFGKNNHLTELNFGYFCQPVGMNFNRRPKIIEEVLQCVTSRFPQLRTFNIGFANSLDLHKIAQNLNKLEHLWSLRLIIEAAKWPHERMSTICPVKSVKKLHFDVHHSYEHFSKLLYCVFPNTEEIILQCENEDLLLWVKTHVPTMLLNERFKEVDSLSTEEPLSYRMVRDK